MYDYAEWFKFTPVNFQVPYGWNFGVLFNLIVMVPTYIILFHSDETPQYLMTHGRIPEALKVARRCGMIEEVN